MVGIHASPLIDTLRCPRREMAAFLIYLPTGDRYPGSMIDVMSELKSLGESFKSSDFPSGLEKPRSLWARIPEPKTATANASMVVEYAVASALKAEDLDEAQKWASEAPAFAQKRHDPGEAEFLVGKMAYERREMETAGENFMIANRKSKGRILEGTDPKYRAFLKAR